MPSKGQAVNAKAAASSSSHRASAVPSSGVPLPPEDMAGGPSIASPKDPTSTAATPKKRKPRKLNRPAASSAQSSNPKAGADQQQSSPLNAEIETLKGRIRDLELQVEELYQKATPGAPPKQPRRRGRGKGAPPPPGSPEELVRLESELEATQQELIDLHTKASTPAAGAAGKRPSDKTTRTNSGQAVEDDVEEIPRTSAPAADSKSSSSQRQVTVAGSYRIPLPSTVSMDDVKTIQSGLNSANTVARSLLDAHRAQKAAQAQVKASGATDNSKGEAGSKGWGEWIGGYSMSIARMVNNIEADAAVEASPAGSSRPSTSRPKVQQRIASAPAPGNPSPKDATGSGTNSAGRPKLKKDAGSGRKPSQQQMESLMA